MKMVSSLKIKILIIIIYLFVFTISPQGKEVESNDLIRLHIIANSDVKEDQELKLKVRDEVVTYLRPNIEKAKNQADAEKIIESNLRKIEEIAEAKVKKEGYAYPVEAKLGDFNFPVKAYNDFVLPAGEYRALKVIIGEGAGANWWCVMFPPICFVDLNHQVLASTDTRDPVSKEDSIDTKDSRDIKDSVITEDSIDTKGYIDTESSIGTESSIETKNSIASEDSVNTNGSIDIKNSTETEGSSDSENLIAAPDATKFEYATEPQIEVRFKAVELFNTFKSKLNSLFS